MYHKANCTPTLQQDLCPSTHPVRRRLLIARGKSFAVKICSVPSW